MPGSRTGLFASVDDGFLAERIAGRMVKLLVP